MFNQIKFFLSDLFKLPERAIIAGFVLAIGIGALFLMLPKASTEGTLSFVDALFTATSATCVTGLSVVDTGKQLSTFGQAVVLILIQAGGLGIMTISTMFLIIMGKRPSITGVVAVQDSLTLRSEKGFRFILRDVALLTAFIEGVGVIALFLYFFFKVHFPFSRSIYFAVFHAISAFCNAGFSLFSDSFIRFQKSFFFNIVICLLIITGGIGFIVLSEIREKKKFSSLSLHSKLVISTTLILILLGTVLITVMEWNNTMSHLSAPFKVLAGFFQSVTARTAGFNTLPIEKMANETLFLLILLMFIGASPGSCGGGIKTSTFATIFLMGISRLKGYENPHAFRRSISKEGVGKAIS
ncbi:MAG: Trk family potassium uptake protein, partial [Deltaproteobacteria bacterium]